MFSGSAAAIFKYVRKVNLQHTHILSNLTQLWYTVFGDNVFTIVYVKAEQKKKTSL